jgi:hypothetical protein
VHISGNSIFANGAPDALFPLGAIAVDLVGASGALGVTPNDPGDRDAGGNGLQNFPVLAGAERGSGGLRITGSLNSLALQSFTVEFFASAACDRTGFGQGERFLGALDVSTDAAGNAVFDTTLTADSAIGESITAAATQLATGNTSEFSACVTVVGGVCPADFNHDNAVNSQDFFDFLTAFFAGSASADFNADGAVNSQDFFDFLTAFFAGC